MTSKLNDFIGLAAATIFVEVFSSNLSTSLDIALEIFDLRQVFNVEAFGNFLVIRDINISETDFPVELLCRFRPVFLHCDAVLAPWSAELDHPDVIFFVSKHFV